MDYKMCWEKLKDKLKDIKRKSLTEEDGWITILTADIMLSLLGKIVREVQEEEKIYLINIRDCFNGYCQFLFKGSKENLMTLIGCLHSTSTVKIERIDYREAKTIPYGIKEMKYFIKNDNVYVVTALYTESEEKNEEQR